jgi:hypothetical protein
MIPLLWSVWFGIGACDSPAPPVAAPPAVPPSEPAPARLHRDLTFSLEAELFLREPLRWLEPVRIYFPAVEWQDETGDFHI